MKLWPRYWHPFLFVISALVALVVFILVGFYFFLHSKDLDFAGNNQSNVSAITASSVLSDGKSEVVSSTASALMPIVVPGTDDSVNELSSISRDIPAVKDLDSQAYQNVLRPFGNPVIHTDSRSITKISQSLVTRRPEHPMIIHPYPPIEYPSESRREGQQGRVLLEVTINVDHTIKSARVSKSSGYPLLDQAALKGVLSWKVDPPSDAMNVVYFPVTFKLNELVAEKAASLQNGN